ncbi:MAG: hypothetical protein KBC19_01490 [Candidatus Moranbacteria bacterium]|nr:hypothetical protein [Candidatus Moranbacteria bacterium]
MKTELSNEFYPLLAGYYDESDFEAYRAMWIAFRELPIFSRNLLTSSELPIALQALSERFHLDQSTTAFVSVMTRKIIFQEWNEEQSRAELTAWCQEFDSKNISRLEEIFTAVKNDILTITPKEEAEEEKKHLIARMTLLEALAQYPQLGQQTITETRIKLKASVELVRGSLINWLKCYREELGVGYHDAMLRGQFLFRSQNGIKLTDEEHGRIEILLRSLEDRETVEIDTEHQVLIFPPYIGPKNSQPEQQKQAETFITGAPLASNVPPVSLPANEESKSVSPHEIPGKESSNQVPNETGSLHVLNKGAQFSPVHQTIGTLHFSSKHVLPVEKKIQSERKVQSSSEEPNTQNVSLSTLSRSSDDVPVVSQNSKVNMVTPSMSDIPHPAPAPKRIFNLSYIPKPYRIDPIKREQPEKE